MQSVRVSADCAQSTVTFGASDRVMEIVPALPTSRGSAVGSRPHGRYDTETEFKDVSVSQVRSDGCFTVRNVMMCCFLYTFAYPCLVQVSRVKVGGALVGQCRDFRSPCPVRPVGGSSASALCTASLRRQCISRELWSKKLEQQFVQVVYTPAGGAVSRRSASPFCSSRLGQCSRRVDVSTSSVQYRGVRVQQLVKSNGQVRSTLLSPSCPPPPLE